MFENRRTLYELRCVLLACVFLTCGLTCAVARADEPPTPWAILGGGATALVPMAIGSYLFADNEDEKHRSAGALTMVTGLALAPIVSHLAVKEWTRAGIFGAIPVACAVSMAVLVGVEPSVTAFGSPQTRLTFGILMSFATLSAGVGLLDTLGAGRRARAAERRPRTTRRTVLPMPFGAPGGGGLTVGGSF